MADEVWYVLSLRVGDARNGFKGIFWACPLSGQTESLPLRGVGLASGFAIASSRRWRDPPFGRPSASLTQSPSSQSLPAKGAGETSVTWADRFIFVFMVGLPGDYGVRAHLPDGGRIWIKGLLFVRRGNEVKIQKGEGFIKSYRIEGDYVEIFFYTPHEAGFDASPFGVGWLLGRDERDRYQEYFL